jgi:tetratricopeptide (TPR) repeat protein
MIFALLILGTAQLAAAQSPSESAREHYRKGTTYYDLSRYREAAEEYAAAYEAVQDPAFLYNIAQAYRFAGDHAHALSSYKAYLRRVPDASNRDEIEGRIRTLEKQVAADKQKAATTATTTTQIQTQETRVVAQPGPTAADRVEGRRKKIAGLGVALGGVLLLGAGGAMGGLAYGPYNEINHPAPNYVFDPSAQSRLQTYQTLEFTFIGVGGAMTLAGIIVYGVGAHQSRSAGL